MDPVTHLAAGAIGAQAIRKSRRDRRLFIFCILAAWLPDIDNFIGFLGMEFYLVHHRGLTHSFIGGGLLAAVFVGIFKLFARSFPFKKGFILAYIFIGLHIFLDLITSYGTQILFPLTNTRYALTSVFILDPIYTFVMVYLMYRTFKSPNTRKTIAIVGMFWIFLYPAMNLGIRYTLQYYIEDRLRTEGMEFTRLDVSTDILSPIFWKVIVDGGTTYQIGGVNLLQPNAPITFTSFQKADQKLFRTLGESASLFNTYHWFFDFPIVRTEMSEDGKETRVMLEDLRFASTLSFIRNVRKGQNLPFSLIAVLNEQKQLIRYYYRGPGQARMIEPLE